MYDYYIIADYVTYNDCLVCTAGHTKEFAEQVLQEVLNGVAQGEAQYKGIVGNVRIMSERSERCWWNQGGLD